jgi:uncharacterized MnhB-related membrane protein
MGNMLTLLVVASASFFFMLANLALKLMGDMPAYLLYPVVGTTVVAGCWMEIAAFHHAQFGLVVVMILGLEMLFSVAVAHIFLREHYSTTNLSGIMLMIIGMGMLHLPASDVAHAEQQDLTFRQADIDKGPRVMPVDVWQRSRAD